MTNSRGIVIFAYNSTFDYVRIANVCAALTKKYMYYDPNELDDDKCFKPMLPVTLITDEFGAMLADRRFIDNIIIHTSSETNTRTIRTTHDIATKTIDWKNLTRADVYELTPYDQTLLLDCDYMMFNNNLIELFSTDLEFTCYSEAFDVTGMDTLRNDDRLNQYSIPMLWATAIYFRKSAFSKSVFDMMHLVKDNYSYYAKVYGFKPTPFRNDFALSIAYHAMSGYGIGELLPYKLPTLTPMTDVVDFRPDGSLLYQYKNKDRHICTGRTWDTDIHIMNKEIFTPEMMENIIDYATDR